MYFTSTRNNNIKINASQAIKQGISNEGGLFVPSDFYTFSTNELSDLVNKSYNERAAFILSKVLNDFTDEEIKFCVDQAYKTDKFSSKNIAPTVKLGNGLFMLELWHGPTCAFKDMALQILPYLVTLSVEKTGEKSTVLILVATSGDTGKAALEGFKDVKGTKILVFYPTDGVSKVQKLQMTTQEGGNVGVCGIYGNFDDAQNGVKDIFTSEQINKTLKENGYIFSSANSINWGRLAPQIAYYFSSYFDLVKQGEIALGDKINFCVPTGNFGNILAGYYAKKMGLPINKLICASNKNNVLTEFINSGTYDKNRAFFTTVSPSMDILISSNLERLLFDLLNNDDKELSSLMKDLKEKGIYKISPTLKETLSEIFFGGYCDDNATKAQIKETYDKCGYVADTHTAVALKVYEDYKAKTGDNTKTVICSTASPFKFSKPVLEGLKNTTFDEECDEFLFIDTLCSEYSLNAPIQLTELKNKQVLYSNTCKKEDMAKTVLSLLES